MKLLVVEDEVRLCDNIARHLLKEGYAVEKSYSGLEAMDHIRSYEYDAIILDIMLPGTDGLTILAHMRSQGNRTPVILLTAMDTVNDRIRGLDSGADDYLTKPFSLEELSARIRALIRRQSVGQTTFELKAGPLVLNTKARTAERDGKTIQLTAKEYSILEYLLHNKGVVVTREKLMHHIWNNDYELQSNIIDVYIRTLRRKIDDGHDEKIIHTLRGIGYIIRNEETVSS